MANRLGVEPSNLSFGDSDVPGTRLIYERFYSQVSLITWWRVSALTWNSCYIIEGSILHHDIADRYALGLTPSYLYSRLRRLIT